LNNEIESYCAIPFNLLSFIRSFIYFPHRSIPSKIKKNMSFINIHSPGANFSYTLELTLGWLALIVTCLALIFNVCTLTWVICLFLNPVRAIFPFLNPVGTLSEPCRNPVRAIFPFLNPVGTLSEQFSHF